MSHLFTEKTVPLTPSFMAAHRKYMAQFHDMINKMYFPK